MVMTGENADMEERVETVEALGRNLRYRWISDPVLPMVTTCCGSMRGVPRMGMGAQHPASAPYPSPHPVGAASPRGTPLHPM